MRFAYRFSLLSLAIALSTAGRVSAQDAEPAAEETSAESRKPEWVTPFNAGVALMQEGKFREAVGEFNNAIRVDQMFPEAFIGKGDALYAMEDYEGAVQAYSSAINLPSAAAAIAHNGRAEAAMKLNMTDMASGDLQRALELDPNNPRILSNVGHLLVNNLGDPNGALKRLDAALAINDQDARAYRDRGTAHAQLGEFTDGVADLERAVAIDPADHENFERLAAIHLAQGQYEPGIAALTKAIEVYKPKARSDAQQFISGYLARADAHMGQAAKETDPAQRQAELEASVADADAVLALYPDRFPESGLAFYRRGRALRMLERYAEAVDSLTRSIQVVPAGQEVNYASEAHMFRGICWYYMGSNQLARGDFEKAASTGGGYQDPRIDLWIGFTHAAEEDYRDAIDSYSKAIAKDPSFAIAYVNRGRAYADLEEYPRAIESFNNAILVEPSDAEHYYRTGAAYLKLKEFDKAAYFLELALRQKNARPEMNRTMAKALRALGRGELASEYERKAPAPKQSTSGG